MIKKLIKLAVILIIGVLVYNYFLGTPDEKETSRRIFSEVKDVAVGVKDLVKSEKEKFDAGKYDDALEKVGNVLSKLKSTARDIDQKYVPKIDDLNERRQKLRKALSDYEEEERRNDTSEVRARKRDRDTTQIKKDLEELLRETESLIGEMEKN